MMPTADQVATAIVAAFTALRARSSAPNIATAEGLNKRAAETVRRARAYSAIALHEVFWDCPADVIGRMVGAVKPIGYVQTIQGFRKFRRIPWFDPVVLARVKASLGDVGEPVQQVDRDETEEAIAFTGAHDGASGGVLTVVDLPAFEPKIQDFVRFGRKKRLEDELRQAVLNTGGRIK